MKKQELLNRLELCPIIAAVQDTAFEAALDSPAEVIFCLKSSLLTVAEQVRAAHAAGKCIFVHLDLAEGIGKDKVGIAYLASIGADGVISTRTQLVRQAKECGLVAVQRFFALDSKGKFTVIPSLKVPKEDIKGAVGAGDSFCAGCLYAIYNNYSDTQMLEFASAAAACNLLEANAVDGMKPRNEIIKLAEKYGRLTL